MFAIIFGIALALGVLLNLIAILITSTNYLSLYAMIEQMQLIFLLTLIRLYFPARIIWFFHIMRFLLLEFNFIYFEKLLFDAVDYSETQPNSMLEILGFEFKSGIVNIFENICVLLIILFLHMIFYIFYSQIKRINNPSNN